MRTATPQRGIVPKAEGIFVETDGEGRPYVNRTMPLLMNDHFDKKEWKSFCDKLDNALSPICKFKRRKKNMYILLGVNLVLLLINVTETVVRRRRQSNDNDNDSNDNNGFQFGIGDIVVVSHLSITCVVTMAFLLYTMHWQRTTGRTIRTQFRKVCNQFSQRKPELNFSVVYDDGGGEKKTKTKKKNGSSIISNLRVDVSAAPKRSVKYLPPGGSNFFLVPKMKTVKKKKKEKNTVEEDDDEALVDEEAAGGKEDESSSSESNSNSDNV